MGQIAVVGDWFSNIPALQRSASARAPFTARLYNSPDSMCVRNSWLFEPEFPSFSLEFTKKS